jgi:hypothetical protein
MLAFVVFAFAGFGTIARALAVVVVALFTGFRAGVLAGARFGIFAFRS